MLGVLLSDDLLFSSRITGTAASLGITMKTARSIDILKNLVQQQLPQGIVVDLAHPELVIAELIDWLKSQGPTLPRIVAYGSHVDTETLKRARAAGCDVVLPRSRFVEDLPTQLTEWLR